MSTYILLLRGINVGGRNVLRMGELAELLRSLGLRDVETYAQSGNVVFRAEREPSGEPEWARALEREIADAIEDGHGFRPRVLLFGSDRLEEAIESHPFPEAEAEPKTLHFFFLASEPADPDLEALEQVRADSERFHLADGVFYLHAPDGIGRSKLAGSVERHLGVAATARNWRTVRRLGEMAGVS